MDLRTILLQGVAANMSGEAVNNRMLLDSYVKSQALAGQVSKGAGTVSLSNQLIALKAAGFAEDSVPYKSIEKIISDLSAM